MITMVSTCRLNQWFPKFYPVLSSEVSPKLFNSIGAELTIAHYGRLGFLEIAIF